MSFLKPVQEKRIRTVTQVTMHIMSVFQRDADLMNIDVSGEIGTCSYYRTGTVFFTLKDSGSSIPCVMFASNTRRLSFRLEAGMEVVAHGTVSVYQKDGKYQFYVDRVRKQGKGKLFEEFEKTKKKLEAEGVFDPAHKKRIPAYAKKIGVVTSRTGAVIHDIENVSRRRNPFVQIVLYPAKVQGDGAALSVIKGLEYFENTDVDTLIIGRGGGSMEDLWEFNSEELARAIYRCTKPVISAVGHETDYTMADFAADMRAPTPSAAAELAVFEYSDFLGNLNKYTGDISKALKNIILKYRNTVLEKNRVLQLLSPRKYAESVKERTAQDRVKLESLMKASLARARVRADRSGELCIFMQNIIMNARVRADESERLHMLMQKKIDDDTSRLKIIIEKMKGLSPLYRLDSGYSYVSGAGGNNISSIKNVKPGDRVTIYMKDGRARAEIISTEPAEASGFTRKG